MNSDTPADAPLDRPLDLALEAWPSVTLDPVDRMRALAAGLPHVASNETLFDVPYETFWSFIADLEQNTPRFEAAVRRLDIVHREGDSMRIESQTPVGFRLRFDVVLRPGFCLMRSKTGDIGMAARPEPHDRTRFFHFEGSRGLGRLLRPYFAWNIRQDFRKLRRILTET